MLIGSHRACLVDFDGTLYRAMPLKLAMAAELLASAPQSMRTLRRFRLEHERREEAVSDPAANPFERQLRRTAEALGLPSEEVREVVDRWMFQRPAKWIFLFRRRTLLAELRDFQADGGKLALVSDYPVRGKLDRFDLHFDTVVASGEREGPTHLKPDPEGYLLAARRLGVAPHECLVLGDRDDRDGEAAARAGMSYRRVR